MQVGANLFLAEVYLRRKAAVGMKKLGPMISLKARTSAYVRLAPAVCTNAGRRAFSSSSCGTDESQVVDGELPVPATIDGQQFLLSSAVVEEEAPAPVSAAAAACRSASKCRLGSSFFPAATSWRQELLGPFSVGFANWQGLAVENVDWGPSNAPAAAATQAEEVKRSAKDTPLSVSAHQYSIQDILELIASKERELEALRAALKAKEKVAAESRASARRARDSPFTTSALPSASSFSPLTSWDQAVRGDPVHSPAKQPPAPTPPSADVPSQASQETSPRPSFPPVNQRPNRIRVDRLAGEKYQMVPLHPPGSFRPGSFYDKLQKENELLGSSAVVIDKESDDGPESVLRTREDGGEEEKPVWPRRVRPPPKIIPPVEIKPYKSLADRLYEEHFGHPAPPNLQRSYPPGSFYDRCQKEKLKREAEEAKRRREAAAEEASQASSGFKDVGPTLGSRLGPFASNNVPEIRSGTTTMTTTDKEDPLLRIQRMPTMPPRRIPKIPYAPSVEHRRRNNNRPSPYNNQSPYYNQQASSMMPGDWRCERCNANNFSRNMQCYRCQADRLGGSEAGRAAQTDRPSSFRPGEQ